MMLHEFSQRTSYKPTLDEYREIENDYYEFEGNKAAFLQQWRARYIQARYEIQAWINQQLIKEYETIGKTPKFFALKKLYLEIDKIIY